MKVLVAVDLKKDAANVVQAVIPWAERLGAVLDLLYTDPFRSYAAETENEELAAEYQRMVGEDTRDLDGLLASIPRSNRGKSLVSDGQPAPVICDAAVDYDLVVVATAGRTGLLAWVVGSVAESVVRTSPKPVLVLRLA
jgi:nucleotide-binding universal stress UspA family protein